VAEVIPFPLARRVDFVWRQADYALSLKPAKGEAHIERELEKQRQSLLRKGAHPKAVDRECRSAEAAIRAAMWNMTFSRGGAA